MSKEKAIDTLGDELPREMKRVRDEVLPYYTPEVNGQFAAQMMRNELDLAAKALAEQDIPQMILCLECLRGFKV